MKHFDKFYEVGNNRYYTIVADDELFIATESFINLGKKKLFRKQDYITQGIKLLKFTTPIAILFNALENIPKIKGQRGVHKDMLQYEHINNKELKETITNSYEEVIRGQRVELDNWLQLMRHELEDKMSSSSSSVNQKEFDKRFKVFQNRYDDSIRLLKERNPLNTVLDLKDPTHTGCNIIRTMLNNGLEHLYTERVTAFANNVFLYEQDCFGTITIYRIMTIKNVVKSIDTFIYDKNLIGTFLKTMYEKENK